MGTDAIAIVEAGMLKRDRGAFAPGDTVRVRASTPRESSGAAGSSRASGPRGRRRSPPRGGGGPEAACRRATLPADRDPGRSA